MPFNKRYPLRELIAALGRYPLTPRRRITIEYTLIRGINDGDSHARELARVLRKVPCKVNLIPMNPVPGTGFEMPLPSRVEAFHARLREQGYNVFVRKQRGDDIAAACGQLALAGEAAKKKRLPTVGSEPHDGRVSTMSESVRGDG